MTAFLLLLALIGGYLVVCRIWPYVDCDRCQGSGRRPSPSRTAWRDCSRCKGRGRQRRLFAGRPN